MTPAQVSSSTDLPTIMPWRSTVSWPAVFAGNVPQRQQAAAIAAPDGTR